MPEISSTICELSNQNLFIVAQLVELNAMKLFIYGDQTTIEVYLSNEKLKECLGTLEALLGGPDIVLMVWNWKDLLSFVKRQTNKDFKLEGKLFELEVLESYAGDKQPKPVSFQDAKNRLKKLIEKKSWNQIHKTYQEIYLPLIFTLPKLEACGLTHKSRKIVYSHYEIDGQVNGRMCCNNPFAKHSFNPHILKKEDKENLLPPHWDSQFLTFDYKHMEVSVLSWLTQDRFLKQTLKSGKDFYTAIWDALMPIPCNASHRQTCKQFFLPVVYGIGVSALAESIKWPLKQTQNLIGKINDLIPDALDWIRKQLNNNLATDYFGRQRYFEENHKIRNFLVQSPAALICLHKLNKLSEQIQVCMHIHDGYVVLSKKDNIEKTRELGRQILEAEESLFPGLVLKTTCSIGL